MMTRRNFILALAALTGGSAAYTAWSFHKAANKYSEAINTFWRQAPNNLAANQAAINRELVRYATMAASSHNTQCWKFRLADEQISILPDWQRRCPAVDPDDHHLFVSLGCAAENLSLAAAAYGKYADVRFDAGSGEAIVVGLKPSNAIASPLFKAIPNRQCTRNEYSGRKVNGDDLKLLVDAARGNGVELVLITEHNGIENILDYVVRGNTAQLNDEAFVKELVSWIRFSDDEAVRLGDGLFSRSSGNPAIPRWLGTKLLNFVLTAKNENDKYARQIRSSSGIAVFVSEQNDKQHWVETGRSYERFALQATALGIKNAFINQPVEVSELRPQLASYLGLGVRRPDLVVRFGYGDEMPKSMRRPLDQVIVV
ncbi:MAG: Tat pathway signal protein [Blastocatellales bacterium]